MLIAQTGFELILPLCLIFLQLFCLPRVWGWEKEPICLGHRTLVVGKRLWCIWEVLGRLERGKGGCPEPMWDPTSGKHLGGAGRRSLATFRGDEKWEKSQRDEICCSPGKHWKLSGPREQPAPTPLWGKALLGQSPLIPRHAHFSFLNSWAWAKPPIHTSVLTLLQHKQIRTEKDLYLYR